ncbi:hypothetical protein BESB_073120 [Besnoitia besnoiti]|uniref:Transmembrane protein n=1 Tax=Besnoitia besnoiti TaxID=94643 RepID=A0A2A9MFK3_BESBE|nr:uncharacterized protein BESB_073120 [Besnoitia besnoiti]PFH34160.1 hypothetical protein BESB_073120 [Besnoitia besnoiti]
MNSHVADDEDEARVFSDYSSESGSSDASGVFKPQTPGKAPSTASTGGDRSLGAVTRLQLFEQAPSEDSETESDSDDDQDARQSAARWMRWLVLAGFCFCIPWGIGTYLGLCTYRRNDRGLRLLGRLSAILWMAAWAVFIAFCIAAGILVMRVTHVLSEKAYGTVVFMGLMPARTWADADLLHHAYRLGFDAVSISPPGIGGTTNITSQKGGFYTDENFLSQVLESCLDIQLNSTVFVAHSNIITRQFFFPLLMRRPLFGFVLFDTYAGHEWITEVNPMMNDHEYYQPKTRNYRVRQRSQVIQREILVRPNKSTAAPQQGYFWPVSVPRVLRASQCIAAPTDETTQNWDSAEPGLLGPFQFFSGKYKVAGWATKEQELLRRPLDPPPSKKKSLLSMLSSGDLRGTSETSTAEAAQPEGVARVREIPIEYFDELKTVLSEFLKEIKDRVDIGDYYPERLPVVFRGDRRQAYIHAREETTLIPESQIYCLSLEASGVAPEDLPRRRDVASHRSPWTDLGKADFESKPSRPSGSWLHALNRLDAKTGQDLHLPPRLRGKRAPQHTTTSLAGRNWQGLPAPPVHPERFSSAQKIRLKEYYARLDRKRERQRPQKQSDG